VLVELIIIAIGTVGAGDANSDGSAAGSSVARNIFSSTARGWCLDYRITYVVLCMKLVQFGPKTLYQNVLLATL